MNAYAPLGPCFWCALAPASHHLEHEALGSRPACDGCDPREPQNTGDASIVARMAAVLLGAARRYDLDLGDERQVDGRLLAAGFRDAEIAAFAERATDRAREDLQASRNPARAGIERVLTTLAFVAMLGSWMIGYGTLCPADPMPHLTHAAEARP